MGYPGGPTRPKGLIKASSKLKNKKWVMCSGWTHLRSPKCGFEIKMFLEYWLTFLISKVNFSYKRKTILSNLNLAKLSFHKQWSKKKGKKTLLLFKLRYCQNSIINNLYTILSNINEIRRNSICALKLGGVNCKLNKHYHVPLDV